MSESQLNSAKRQPFEGRQKDEGSCQSVATLQLLGQGERQTPAVVNNNRTRYVAEQVHGYHRVRTISAAHIMAPEKWIANLGKRYPSSRERYRAAVLREARAICSSHAEGLGEAVTLHLRGLFSHRDGNDQLARACLERVLEIDQDNTECLFDLGNVLTRLDQTSEALRVLGHALSIAPDDPALHCLVARNLSHENRVPEAFRAYDCAKAAEPARVSTYIEAGDLYQSQGQVSQAIEHYQRATALDEHVADAHLRLARAHLRQGAWTLAAEAFRAGLQRGSRADLHAGLGEALLRSGQLQHAADALESALVLDVHNVEACRHLVFVMELLGRRAEAVSAWCRLGEALEHHDLLDEAGAAYGEALARKPDYLKALVRLGWIRFMRGSVPEAIRLFEAALTIEPNHSTAHQRIGWSYAHAGDLKRALKETAWIDRHGPWKRFEQPMWDGASLQGRTILLWVNAGLGDMVQMLRFVPLVKAMGANTLVECRGALLPLVRAQEYVDRAISMNATLPSFDTHAFLATLPHVMGTTFETVPNDPYIKVDADLVTAWGKQLVSSRHRKIGLVWGSGSRRAGTPKAVFRSLPLMTYAPLARVTDATFVSLQLGPAAGELIVPPLGMSIECPLDESCTVLDTAALIMNLDLVITIDTMVAHLAGALGKPVWTLMPTAAAWMWGPSGERTPWYPTMRLFRQTKDGDWAGVVQRVCSALTAW